MAVEKMKMMNLVALKQDAHSILREIVLNGSIHITNAENSENFTMKYMDSQIGIFNDMGVAVDKIRPYHREKVFKKRKYKELLDQMFDFFNIKEDDVTLNDLKELNYSEKLKLLDDISLKSSSNFSNNFSRQFLFVFNNLGSSYIALYHLQVQQFFH